MRMKTLIVTYQNDTITICFLTIGLGLPLHPLQLLFTPNYPPGTVDEL